MDLIKNDINFDAALKVVLKHEGGYTNNISDSGGATNFGISLRFIRAAGIDIDMDGKIDIEDIKKMNKNNAREIYKKYWWDKYNYGAINNLEVATKVFDLSVNMGDIESHKIVQRSINLMLPNDMTYLTVDGLLGEKSIQYINYMDLQKKSKMLITTIKSQGTKFYEGLVDKNGNLDIFLKGWLNRLYD